MIILRRPAVLAVAAIVASSAVLVPGSARALPSPPDSVLGAGAMPAPPDDVTAESWVVVDAASGHVIASHESEVARTVASTIKVLTALTVVERTSPDDVVVVGDEVRSVDGARLGLRPGDEVPVQVLLDVLIARSGNDVAEALAVHVAGSREAFVDLMQVDAASIGVRGVVTSPSGLDDTDAVTAHDLAIIGAVALAHPQLREVLGRRVVTLPDGSVEESRNELLFTYPGATGVKTGYTRLAGNTLIASALRQDREIVVVVLGSDDDPGRFLDAAALLDHAFAATRTVQVAPTIERLVGGGRQSFEVTSAPVTVGRAATVDVRLGRSSVAADDIDVVVEVDGLEVGRLRAHGGALPAGAPSSDGAAGRGLADLAWHAARAAALGHGVG